MKIKLAAKYPLGRNNANKHIGDTNQLIRLILLIRKQSNALCGCFTKLSKLNILDDCMWICPFALYMIFMCGQM